MSPVLTAARSASDAESPSVTDDAALASAKGITSRGLCLNLTEVTSSPLNAPLSRRKFTLDRRRTSSSRTVCVMLPVWTVVRAIIGAPVSAILSRAPAFHTMEDRAVSSAGASTRPVFARA